MRDAIDFNEIAQSIRTYTPPGYGTRSPYSFDATSVGITPKVLITLIEEVYSRDYDPDKCVFYMHPNQYQEFRYEFEEGIRMGRDSFMGRPIKTHPTMPEDCILFMPPDAVSLGGKVYHPQMIGYADLGDTDE